MIRLMHNASERADRIRAGEAEKGFTLIELLVVVIIIGILAAIAIPVFLNQRASAWRATVESDSYTANLAIQTWAGEHKGELPTTLVAGTGAAANTAYYNSSTDVVVNYVTTGAPITSYTLTSKNANITDQVLVFTSVTGKGAWGAAG